MCWISHAIAPREPWRNTSLGHWYWDVPSYAHRYVEHTEFFDKSGEEAKPLWEHIWDSASEPTCSEAPESGAQAVR